MKKIIINISIFVELEYVIKTIL